MEAIWKAIESFVAKDGPTDDHYYHECFHTETYIMLIKLSVIVMELYYPFETYLGDYYWLSDSADSARSLLAAEFHSRTEAEQSVGMMSVARPSAEESYRIGLSSEGFDLVGQMLESQALS